MHTIHLRAALAAGALFVLVQHSPAESEPKTSMDTAPRARLVGATVSFDGVEVLRASTSDDGKPDADAVWDYLHHLTFQPTEEFERLGKPAVGASWRIPSATAPQDQPLPVRFSLDIAYGGKVDLRELVLVPAKGDKGGWCIDPGEVERWFRHRLIRRQQAADLRDPKRVK